MSGSPPSASARSSSSARAAAAHSHERSPYATPTACAAWRCSDRRSATASPSRRRCCAPCAGWRMLGDLGLPGLFSTKCRDGDCCAAFREDLRGGAAGRDPRRRRALPQRWHRRLAGLRRPLRQGRRGRLEPLRHVRAPRGVSGVGAGARRFRRRLHGMDEPDRLVLPARGELHHADAHRRRQHLRGAAAAVRGAARDGRRQARAGAALPPEGPLRPARRRHARVGRRPPLQPRLPPPPHRRPRARLRGFSCARWPAACSPST